jgi:isopentenyl-diphosphate delta-isomerase
MSGGNVIRNRKEEHVDICRGEPVSARRRYWDDIALVHSALPEIDIGEIDLSVTLFGKRLEAPIIISAMTGGYPGAKDINRNLAKAAAECGVGLGLGSQRAALEDPSLEGTFSIVKEYKPPLVLGNVGAPQLIKQGGKRPLGIAELKRAQRMVGADLLAVHLNFLQEVAEWDGDTQSRGCLPAISELSRRMPIVVKETGAGIGREVARRLLRTDIRGIDVGGAGGTSFAAVEVYRARRKKEGAAERLGNTFWDWGIPSPVSVLEIRELHRTFPIIATGGVLNGLDVARALALGATAAGIARPLLAPAMESAKAVSDELEMIKAELRAAMFLTGSADLEALSRAKYIVSGESARWLERR